jgi:hypothetical protein
VARRQARAVVFRKRTRFRFLRLKSRAVIIIRTKTADGGRRREKRLRNRAEGNVKSVTRRGVILFCFSIPRLVGEHA